MLISQPLPSRIQDLCEKSGCHNSETALALLQTATAEMEEESEAIADKFLEGELDVDSFLEQFTTRRKLMHLRRVKADKLTEMVNRRTSSHLTQNSNNDFNSSSFYRPPQPPTSAQHRLPYPTGSTPMIIPEPFSASSYYGS